MKKFDNEIDDGLENVPDGRCPETRAPVIDCQLGGVVAV